MGDVVQDSVEAAQEQVCDHHAIFQLRPETHVLLVKGTNAVTPRGPFAHVATQMLLVMSIDLINPPTLVQAQLRKTKVSCLCSHQYVSRGCNSLAKKKGTRMATDTGAV